MKKPHLYCLLVVWLLAACSQQSNAVTPTSEVKPFQIVLPTLKPEATAQGIPAALLTGVLELNGTCVRVRTTNNTSFLIIWASSFKLEGRSVVNIQRTQRISFGDTVALGGGEMPDGWQFVTELALPLDKNCPGPYWLGGTIVD